MPLKRRADLHIGTKNKTKHTEMNDAEIFQFSAAYVTRSEKRDHSGFFVNIVFWVLIDSAKSHEFKGESPMKKYCSQPEL